MFTPEEIKDDYKIDILLIAVAGVVLFIVFQLIL